MDETAILDEISRRNALREAHGLPLLDVSAEFGRLVSIERQREYHLACAEHADEYEAIRLQVLTEHSANFTNNIGGRWAIGHQTRLRFTAYIAERYGIHPPGRIRLNRERPWSARLGWPA